MSDDSKIERVVEEEAQVIYGELLQLQSILDEVDRKIEELKATKRKMQTLKGVFEEVSESRELDLKQIEIPLEYSPREVVPPVEESN
tara:strand:+ start:542 stop:802 length:261 start_codon:yes stop_codon:yes gene_type:complete